MSNVGFMNHNSAASGLATGIHAQQLGTWRLAVAGHPALLVFHTHSQIWLLQISSIEKQSATDLSGDWAGDDCDCGRG